jgi:MFS transporter, ACS family, D-galactonate transporter
VSETPNKVVIGPAREASVWRARYAIVGLICGAVTINYLDRALLGVALPGMQQEFGLQATLSGLLLSAFSWTYFLAQLPSGALLDRFGVKITYVVSIAAWSAITLLHGAVSGFRSLFGLRLALGLAEAPCFPANSKIIAMWCPRSERARAVGLYTAAEYVGLGFLSPILFWGLSVAGWRSLFVVAGLLGVAYSIVFARRYFDPDAHPTLSAAERDDIVSGGGLLTHPSAPEWSWAALGRLLAKRQILGVCLGQFAVHSTLTFFLTWFPSYLVTARHIDWIKAGFMASLPYLAAFAGVLVAGFWSDRLLTRGASISVARKLPVITGLLVATVIVAANYVESSVLIVVVLAVAFFAQGMSGTSWATVPEIAPPEQLGLVGGLFNAAGNLAGIVTPVAIGVIVDTTGSFVGALYFVGGVAFVGACSWIFIVGPLERVSPQRRLRGTDVA